MILRLINLGYMLAGLIRKNENSPKHGLSTPKKGGNCQTIYWPTSLPSITAGAHELSWIKVSLPQLTIKYWVVSFYCMQGTKLDIFEDKNLNCICCIHSACKKKRKRRLQTCKRVKKQLYKSKQNKNIILIKKRKKLWYGVSEDSEMFMKSVLEMEHYKEKYLKGKIQESIRCLYFGGTIVCLLMHNIL